MDNSVPYRYYGDDLRWFVGVVVNSTPPPALQGRVKVRIHGIHNISTGEIKESDLPWAQVLIPTTEGGVSGIGNIPNLLPGASLFGYFLDGKSSQLPIIVGSFPRIEFPADIQKRESVIETTMNYDQTRQQNFVEDDIVEDAEREGNRSRRRSQSIKFFIDNGYIPIHAAALTGVIETLSGFVIYELDELGDKQGILQWSKSEGPRFNNLIDFSKNYVEVQSWKRYSLQLEFILYELRTYLNAANVKLLQTTSIEDAVFQLVRYYIRRSITGTDAVTFAERAYEGALSE